MLVEARWGYSKVICLCLLQLTFYNGLIALAHQICLTSLGIARIFLLENDQHKNLIDRWSVYSYCRQKLHGQPTAYKISPQWIHLKKKRLQVLLANQKSTKHTRYFRKEEKWKCERKIFSSLPFRKVKEIPRTNCIQVLDLFTLSHKINLWAGPLKLSLSEKCTQCITGMHQHHYLFKPHTKYIILVLKIKFNEQNV